MLRVYLRNGSSHQPRVCELLSARIKSRLSTSAHCFTLVPDPKLAALNICTSLASLYLPDIKQDLFTDTMNSSRTQSNPVFVPNTSSSESIVRTTHAPESYVTAWERLRPHLLAAEQSNQSGYESHPKDGAEKSMKVPKVVPSQYELQSLIVENSSTSMSSQCWKRQFKATWKRLPKR